ncbi:glycosyltransferase [Lacrimispora xylanisolvens]|uniref:glycosyltransferase n=1 Tax=Lacrimispora xylanisolvens TaxID=384636 RepID=UPI0024027979
MISVVMATYNGEKYIKAQLESILRQSRKPDEIIINDDNSSDSTIHILETIKNTSDIIIDIQVNKLRLGYARNFKQAIGRTRGEIIFLSDQDDVWHEKKIEKCVNILDKNDKILALSTGYYITDSKLKGKKSSDRYKEGQIKKISWKKFMRHPKYPGMSMVFRRKIWSYIEIMDWKPNAAHDWMINQYAASNDGMYYFSEKLVYYRQHETNTTGITIKQTDRNICNNRIKLINELIDANKSIEPDLDKAIYLKKMILFQTVRKKLLLEKRFFKLLIYEFLKIKYISVKSIIGDMYVCLKNGRTSHVHNWSSDSHL